MPQRVLFVCMGNICRSPAAEGVFAHLVAERGLAEAIEVDSAGTIGYHAGDPADPRMIEAAGKRGYKLTSRARQFATDDFERFDLIVAMDRANLADILARDGHGRHRAKVALLGEFLPDEEPREVPDPYYGGADGFERVLDMLERAAPAILARLTVKSA